MISGSMVIYVLAGVSAYRIYSGTASVGKNARMTVRSITQYMSMTAITPATPRVGRPCGVCSLSSSQRTSLETALAEGVSISRISKQPWSPGRESITHHINGGHLPAQLQERVERAQGVDYTSVVARISDIAARARTTALEAAEAGDRTAVLRAGDSELRALSVLANNNETSEQEIAQRVAQRDLAVALFRLARRDPQAGEAVAVELESMHRPLLADEIRQQFPESRNEISS